jgi:CheY-like chemotaxis protein
MYLQRSFNVGFSTILSNIVSEVDSKDSMTSRVLITDDDPVICGIVKKILSRRLCVFSVCGDAESALALIQREQFDLIISDFMLPGISGVDLVSQIRRNPQGKDIPIIMMSAHNNYAMAGRCKEAGANAFLRKPFSPSQLLLAYDACLRGESQFRS